MGVALNTHLSTCILKIVHIQGKTHNVENVFFHTKRDCSLREVPILKRDPTNENHCSL